MPKVKSGSNGQAETSVNKSDAIREILAQTPKATPKEVVAQLAGKGISVQPSLVYMIKSKAKRKTKKAKRQQIVEASVSLGATNPVQLIIKVKDLSRDAGGINKLKQLVDALAE